ncbi:MAG: RNA-binding S4 domain-containing protein [Paracoccaceae bacterium]
MSEAPQKQRLDKWLWQARFFKTRTLAAKTVNSGHVRVNSVRAGKPAQLVGSADVLTFAQGRDIRVIRIDALGIRRGPAPEAQTLYTDLDPPEAREPAKDKDAVAPNPRFEGKGRPTKRDRRQTDLSRARNLD